MSLFVTTSISFQSVSSTGTNAQSFSLGVPVTVGSEPKGVAFDQKNGFTYVTNYESDSVSVISGSSVTTTVSLPYSSDPSGIAFDSKNGMLYVADYGLGEVSVIATSDSSLATSIGVGQGPSDLVSSGAYIFVSDSLSNSVSIIEASTSQVVNTISNVGSTPTGVAYDSSSHFLYVANYGADSVAVINVKNVHDPVLEGSISVGSGPSSILYDASNKIVYVANFLSNTISIINSESNLVEGTVSVGQEPSGIALAGSTLYISNLGTNSISEIASKNSKVTRTVQIGFQPQGIAYDPAAHLVYIAQSGLDSVCVVSVPTKNANGCFQEDWSQIRYNSQHTASAWWNGPSNLTLAYNDTGATNRGATSFSSDQGESLLGAGWILSNNQTLFVSTASIWGSANAISAVSLLTGSILWQTNMNCSQCVDTLLDASGEGLLFVGDDLGTVTALNQTNGGFVWNYTVDGTGGQYLTYANGFVFDNWADREVICLNATGGNLVWNTTGAGNYVPTVANGVVYSGSIALNESDGDVIYQLQNLPPSANSPIYSNGTVYEGTSLNSVIAVNGSTGSILWQNNQFNGTLTEGFMWAESLAQGMLLVEGNPGTDLLYALNASTGAVLWNFTAQLPNSTSYGLQYSTQIVVNVAVVVSPANGGVMWGLNITSGAEIWNVTNIPGIHAQTRPTPTWGDIILGTSDGIFVYNGTS